MLVRRRSSMAYLSMTVRDQSVVFERAEWAMLTLSGHSSYVSDVTFLPNRMLLVSSSGDSTIKCWDTSTGQLLSTMHSHCGAVMALAASPDGSRLASASADCTCKLRCCDGAATTELWTCSGHTACVQSIAFSADSTRLASAAVSPDDTIRLWDALTGQSIATLHGHSNTGFSSLVFSPDSVLMASASGGDGVILLWDREGDLLATLNRHTDKVYALAFSPDGSRLASGSRVQSIRIWETASQALCSQQLDGHSSWISSLVWSPDGMRLVSASGDCTLKMWDITTGREVSTFRGHSDWIRAVKTMSASQFASASLGKTARIWDAATGGTTVTGGHTGTVWALAWSHSICSS